MSHTDFKPSVVPSDVVTVLNPESNQNQFEPKTLMDISIRDIHNAIIKPSENGGLESVVDSATQKVLISDTRLRLFIPQKMTLILCHIYGCGLCIFPRIYRLV